MKTTSSSSYWENFPSPVIDELIHQKLPYLNEKLAEQIFGNSTHPEIVRKRKIRSVIHDAYRIGRTESLAELEGLRAAMKHITINHNYPQSFRFITWLKTFFS